jgi:hypothetical protein
MYMLKRKNGRWKEEGKDPKEMEEAEKNTKHCPELLLVFRLFLGMDSIAAVLSIKCGRHRTACVRWITEDDSHHNHHKLRVG